MQWNKSSRQAVCCAKTKSDCDPALPGWVSQCDYCCLCAVSVGGVQHPGAEELHDRAGPRGERGHRSAAVQVPHHEAHHSPANEGTSQGEAGAERIHSMMEARSFSPHQPFHTQNVKGHLCTFHLADSHDRRSPRSRACFSVSFLDCSLHQWEKQTVSVLPPGCVSRKDKIYSFSLCLQGSDLDSWTRPSIRSADLINTVSEQVLSKDIIVIKQKLDWCDCKHRHFMLTVFRLPGAKGTCLVSCTFASRAFRKLASTL